MPSCPEVKCWALGAGMLRCCEDGWLNNPSWGYHSRGIDNEPSGENYWSSPAFSLSSSWQLSEGPSLLEIDLCPQIVKNKGPGMWFLPTEAEGTMPWLALLPLYLLWSQGKGECIPCILEPKGSLVWMWPGSGLKGSCLEGWRGPNIENLRGGSQRLRGWGRAGSCPRKGSSLRRELRFSVGKLWKKQNTRQVSTGHPAPAENQYPIIAGAASLDIPIPFLPGLDTKRVRSKVTILLIVSTGTLFERRGTFFKKISGQLA